MSAPRLVLKQSTGWFAAGREVARALELLSDAAFKLFVYLCLNADRHTGRIVLEPADLAGALGKDQALIDAALDELRRRGVCGIRGAEIEIADRFWPYQKRAAPTGEDGQVEFVRQARAAFLAPACVRSRFTPADEKLAIGLYQRGVTIEQLQRAIWLGCARKYTALLNRQSRAAITSLGYFATLVDEVAKTEVPYSYWEYVRRKSEQLGQTWVEAGQAPAPADNDPMQTK